MERPLTTHQAAKLAGVSPSAVLSWIERGWLLATRTPGGHRRIDRDEFLRFLDGRFIAGRDGQPRPKRLLVIDDEPVFARSLTRHLREIAPLLDVETAANAFDGLLAVSTFRPHAVLLDTYMDGLDGVETCRRLKSSAATSHIAVIAMSGMPSPELAQSYGAAGAAAFLKKPIETGEVMTILGL
jgi:excisionase family DNA binding protein